MSSSHLTMVGKCLCPRHVVFINNKPFRALGVKKRDDHTTNYQFFSTLLVASRKAKSLRSDGWCSRLVLVDEATRLYLSRSVETCLSSLAHLE